MSRPKPQILLSSVNPRTYRSDQVLAADGIYAVFYDGKPINLKTVKNQMVSVVNNIKYRRSSFTNPAHAFNRCDQLNRQYKTNLFTVVFMSSGVVVTEKPQDSED